MSPILSFLKKHPILPKKKSKPKKKESDLKKYKAKLKAIKAKTKEHSSSILKGACFSSTGKKPNTKKYVIELVDVHKSYCSGDVETKVLKGINLQIKHGKMIAILGPSGSGKTTLLNLISGLDKADSGDVFVLGYNLTFLSDYAATMFRRKKVGFVFQNYNLLPNLNALENMEVGFNLAAKKNKNLKIDNICNIIGLEDQKNKYPHQMSGGQQQRVSIARALAKNPAILFGDEPTGALDEKTGLNVLALIRKINSELGTTTILVTHSSKISSIADIVIHIHNGKIARITKNDQPKKVENIK